MILIIIPAPAVQDTHATANGLLDVAEEYLHDCLDVNADVQKVRPQQELLVRGRRNGPVVHLPHKGFCLCVGLELIIFGRELQTTDNQFDWSMRNTAVVQCPTSTVSK
jgi:hypothetical protein